MFSILRSLLRHRRLVKDFVIRDLKARYVGSSMGFFWSVVFPIINLFVYMFVFRLVLNARWGDKQGALEVAVVMLAGIVVWAAFSETVSRATNALVDNSNLIQKVVFPAEVLPVYLTISSLINMCIGLPVVLLSVFWIGHMSPPEVSLSIPYDQVDVIGEDGKVVMVAGSDKPERMDVLRPIVMNERQKPYAVGVALTRGYRERVTIPFSLSGTAVEGVDYKLEAREITLPAGRLTGTIYVFPTPDGLVEDPETVVITLGEPENASLLAEGKNGIRTSRRFELTIIDAADDVKKQKPRAPLTPTTVAPWDSNYHPLQLGSSLLALPVLFVLQVLFTVGLGFFLCAFNLFLRDTFHLVGVGITVWMFATPIFYPGFMVTNAGFGWILAINPMHWMIDMYREVLLFGLWPQALDVIRLGVAAAVSFFLGASFFRAHSSKFPDLL